MHLQRIQVPDFRVLKDVDITFEHDFNPRVFPLGSQNGGGKRTLLQLIFVLLHCSTNPNRLLALKNLLSGFNLLDDQDKRVLAIIDIWDGEKVVQLEFFVCRDSYIKRTLKDFNKNKEESNLSFSIFTELKTAQQNISNSLKESKKLQDRIKNIQEIYPELLSSNPSIDTKNIDINQSSDTPESPIKINLKKQLLSNFGIDFESEESDISPDLLQQKIEQAKLKLLYEHNIARDLETLLSRKIEVLISNLKLVNTEYISVYSAKDDNSNNEALLCFINNLRIDSATQFLNQLSNKVFLAAPPTQIFLFLSRKSRKSLFENRNDYYSLIAKSSSRLPGLFTYDFLAVDILIESFTSARDSDFREALETGEYGNSYKNLLKDLAILLQDKKVNLRFDFSGLTFTKDEAGNKVELEPEDLSHGELKRLSIYIWLKHFNIENAIVLMDEVDLALHPDWQYRIATDLVDWVPSNQYILATHSYELCQALTPSHVKVLEPKLTDRLSK